MPSAEFPPDVAGLLGRLRDRLAARGDVVGVYVYGSPATGDYSPAARAIDVGVLVRREPGKAVIAELRGVDAHPTPGPGGRAPPPPWPPGVAPPAPSAPAASCEPA